MSKEKKRERERPEPKAPAPYHVHRATFTDGSDVAPPVMAVDAQPRAGESAPVGVRRDRRTRR